jgi:hypothetical protein
MKEATIEKYLYDQCKARGYCCYKFVSPAQPGVPDRVVIGRGRVLFIELKRPGRKPTPLQAHHINEIQRNGGCAIWLDSKKNIDYVLGELDTLPNNDLPV